MGWDFAERLGHVTRGTTEAYYNYDGSGERVRKVVEKGGVIETRLYLGGFEIFRKKVGNSLELERETLHVMDDTRRIAIVETKTREDGNQVANPTSVQRYQLSNNIESTALELDENANIISYEEYYPYGDTSYRAGRSASEVSQKRYRYTGKEKDDESGLYYYGARYYSSIIGIFISVDPEFEEYLWISSYAYCANNPVKYIDPDGRAIMLAPLILIGAKAAKGTIGIMVAKGALGAVVDVGAQVTAARIVGKDWDETVSNIDVVSIGTSAVISAVSAPGLSAGGTVARTGTRRVVSTVAIALNAAIDINVEREVSIVLVDKSIEEAVVDVVSSVIPGQVVGRATSSLNRAIASDLGSATMPRATRNTLRLLRDIVNSDVVQVGAGASADYVGGVVGEVITEAIKKEVTDSHNRFERGVPVGNSNFGFQPYGVHPDVIRVQIR
jgi:RHS repeat-associated protein